MINERGAIRAVRQLIRAKSLLIHVDSRDIKEYVMRELGKKEAEFRQLDAKLQHCEREIDVLKTVIQEF